MTTWHITYSIICIVTAEESAQILENIQATIEEQLRNGEKSF